MSHCHPTKPSWADLPFLPQWPPAAPSNSGVAEPAASGSPPLPHSSPSRQHQPCPRRESPNGTALRVAGKPRPLCSHSVVLGFEGKPELRAQNASRSSFGSPLSQLSRVGTSTAVQVAVVPAQVFPRPRGALRAHRDPISPSQQRGEEALLRPGGRGNPSTNHPTRKELPVASLAPSGTGGLELWLQEHSLLQSISLLRLQGLNLLPRLPPSTSSFRAGKPTAKPRANQGQPKHRSAAALEGSRRGVSPYETGTDDLLLNRTRSQEAPRNGL